jgi:membrane protein
MARMGDLPKLLQSVGVLEFSRRVWNQVRDDNLFTWAAALAYAWLFALFPFILFLLALIPYLPKRFRANAEQDVPHFLTYWLPKDSAAMLLENINVQGHVKNFLNQQPRGMVLYTGLVVALWAASGGMASTMSALDKCYELDRGRPYYRQRLLAIVMTVAVMVLLLLVACLLPIGGAVKDRVVAIGLIDPHSPLLTLFDVIRWVFALAFMFSVLAIVYFKGPSIKHHFHWITPGAAFCVIVWVLLGIGFRIYMDRMGDKGYDRMYGTLGGVAILLLLFYIDALVLLIGAEINSEIDFEVLKVRRGTRDLRRAEDLDAAHTAI